MFRVAFGACILLAICLSASAAGDFPWNAETLFNKGRGRGVQTGVATVYGEGNNMAGTCSFGSNMANTYMLPWSQHPQKPTTYIAMNDPQFRNSAACGACLWFRGTGNGVGVESKRVPRHWQYGVVDNRCPECHWGALDLARSYSVGDGIWDIEWYLVPCSVGGSKLYYKVTASSPYWFSMVVSNGRYPVKSVQAYINGNWRQLTKTNNNQHAYYNEGGQYSFPLRLRVTPACGKAVEDTMQGMYGSYGYAQFGTSGCANLGSPYGGNSANSKGGPKRAGLPKKPKKKKSKKPKKKKTKKRKFVARIPSNIRGWRRLWMTYLQMYKQKFTRAKHTQRYYIKKWLKRELTKKRKHRKSWYYAHGLYYPSGKIKKWKKLYTSTGD